MGVCGGGVKRYCFTLGGDLFCSCRWCTLKKKLPPHQQVIAATPFVKFVLDFREQLDAAARKNADRAAAVLLPWCEIDPLR